MLWEGRGTAAGTVTVVAGDVLRIESDNFALSGSSVSVTGESAVLLKGTIEASGRVSVVSQTADIVMAADIRGQTGGTLGEILIDAHRDLDLTGGSLGPVTSKLTLHAGRELAEDLNPVSWTVTGANGELDVSTGGDLTVNSLSVLQANRRISLDLDRLRGQCRPNAGRQRVA